MTFEWDENKNQTNKRKHGVSFEEAQTVFYDEQALLEYDELHSEDEDRFRILGCSDKGNILLVVHCIRNDRSFELFLREGLLQMKKPVMKGV